MGKDSLPKATHAEVCEWLIENDFRMWSKRLSRSDIRQEIEAALSKHVTCKLLKECIDDGLTEEGVYGAPWLFEFYGRVRRLQPSAAVMNGTRSLVQSTPRGTSLWI